MSEILFHLKEVQEDQRKLQKILDFINDEIFEEPEEELADIPKEYKILLNRVAQSLDCGLVCFINTNTLELEEIPQGIFDQSGLISEETNDQKTKLKIKHPEWENYIKISPPDSHTYFGIMESFAERQKDSRFKFHLIDALSKRKPFNRFKWKIENSPYRQNWYDFKQKRLEVYVRDEIHYYFNSKNISL